MRLQAKSARWREGGKAGGFSAVCFARRKFTAPTIAVWNLGQCISRFLSKGLFFYYLLNLKLWGEGGEKHVSDSQQLPRIFCDSEVVLPRKTCVFY